jgi:hypothetical protein
MDSDVGSPADGLPDVLATSEPERCLRPHHQSGLVAPRAAARGADPMPRPPHS